MELFPDTWANVTVTVLLLSMAFSLVMFVDSVAEIVLDYTSHMVE